MNETETEWPCPDCGTMIPGTGFSTRQGLNDTHPAKEHATCPSCEMRLVRFPEGRAGLDKGWRDDRSPIEREAESSE